jgi:hypothetical protein
MPPLQGGSVSFRCTQLPMQLQGCQCRIVQKCQKCISSEKINVPELIMTPATEG